MTQQTPHETTSKRHVPQEKARKINAGNDRDAQHYFLFPAREADHNPRRRLFALPLVLPVHSKSLALFQLSCSLFQRGSLATQRGAPVVLPVQHCCQGGCPLLRCHRGTNLVLHPYNPAVLHTQATSTITTYAQQKRTQERINTKPSLHQHLHCGLFESRPAPSNMLTLPSNRVNPSVFSSRTYLARPVASRRRLRTLDEPPRVNQPKSLSAACNQ